MNPPVIWWWWCVEGTGGGGVNSYFRNEAKCRFFVVFFLYKEAF